MNKKWSSDKVKNAQQWLTEQWPELFTPGPDLKPLSLKIHKEILEYRTDNNPEISSRALQEALKRHTTSFGYLYGMTKASHRCNLKGEPVEEITGSNRAWALKTLRLLQRISQKTNKSKAIARKINQLPLHSVKTRSAPAAPAPITRTAEIRYKRKRRVIPPTVANTPTALAS